jgi:hypothetical protein
LGPETMIAYCNIAIFGSAFQRGRGPSPNHMDWAHEHPSFREPGRRHRRPL